MKRLAPVLLLPLLLLTACGSGSTIATPSGGAVSTQTDAADAVTAVQEDIAADEAEMQDVSSENAKEDVSSDSAQPDGQDEETASDSAQPDGQDEETTSDSFSVSDVPAYSGDAYVAVHDNIPYFTSDDYTTTVFETYSALDALGRCGVAYANLCTELMPTEARESISSVIPTGWINNSYDFVDGGYLYNRCHLIGFQLAGENANALNLITGTRYLNINGMLSFENMVADYIKETDYHVLYRVTPIFEGDNLVASGVLMEGWSVEDEGEGICFCIYAYNVQPGVVIDYATGENYAEESESTADATATASDTAGETPDYVLNTRSMKFHYPSCSGVSSMSESNRVDYTGTREELLAQGYSSCGRCNP